MGIEINKLKNIRKRREQNKKRNYLLILISMITLFIFLSFIAKLNSKNRVDRSDMFYVQVLNSSMPLVKTSVFNEEDLVENGFSIKKSILKLFNINSNPVSLIEKEVACMNMNEDENINVTFDPFKLNENSVLMYDNEKNNGLDSKDKRANIYNPKLKKKINKAKPEVFIYHTHTTESFKPEDKFSLDENKNIAVVGSIITNELEKNYGISVVHDKTVHDAMAYNRSYQRSGKTIDKYLKKYGDFKLIIDLHRDSVAKALRTKMNGEYVAKYMFVMAKNNPHFKNNIKHVNKMIQISNKLYPNLCRGALCYNSGICSFNQNKSNNSILIELGSYANNLDEAKKTGKYLARIIAEHINKNS